MKLNKLKGNCKVTEVYTTGVTIHKAYSEGDWTGETHMIQMFTKLFESSSQLKTAIDKGKVESSLKEKDDLRDQSVKALYYLVRGANYHTNPAVKEATAIILPIIDKYGLDIIRESYVIETARVDSLLEDLNVTNVQEKINEISGCADAIVTLQTRQNQFKTAFYEWEQNKAKQANEMNASEYKKTVLQIINDEIVTYLRAMVQVNEEKYAGIHNTILQIINDQNIKVKNRLKKEEEPVDA